MLCIVSLNSKLKTSSNLDESIRKLYAFVCNFTLVIVSGSLSTISRSAPVHSATTLEIFSAVELNDALIVLTSVHNNFFNCST